MRTIEVSAKTRELAIKEALEKLGVERDEVHVEIVDEGSAGIFGFGARNVKLKVSTEVPGPAVGGGRGTHEPRAHELHRGHAPRGGHAPRHEQQPRQPQHGRREGPRGPRPEQPRPDSPRASHAPRHEHPRREQQPRPAPAPAPKPAPIPRTPGPMDAEAEAILREVIQRMGIEATVTSAASDAGELTLKVDSPDSAILIGRKGRTLSSLQYLINRMVHRGEADDAAERITVDVEGYLGRRQEALEELAQRLAQRAKESGRRQRTKPMSPQERRIIHVALENDPDIKTFSLGDASARYVVIAPKDERQAPDDRGPRDRGRRHSERGPRDRREHGPRPPRQPVEAEAPRGDSPDGDDEQQQRQNGGGRRRRRFRRGGRGRGPRPDAAPQNNPSVSDPQDS